MSLVGIRRVAASLLAAALAVSGLTTVAGPAAAAGFALDRLEGTDRYATAAAIALRAFSEADTVVLASGEAGHYADALAGNYLAGRHGAPVLLTSARALPAATAAALAQLRPAEVVVLGGDSAVSRAVEQSLTSTYSVRRIAGANRYATARAIALEPGRGSVGSVGDRGRTAILARGDGFADALVAGPLSYAGGLPVHITDPASLTAATRAALQELDIDHVLIAGGAGAVSKAVESEVASLNGGITVTRLQGESRTATATAIAEYAVAELGFTDEQVHLTRADDFADALAGGPYAGGEQTPIITTAGPTSLGSAASTYLTAHSATLRSGTIFGGAAAVSREVAASAVAAVTAAAPVPSTEAPEGTSPADPAPVDVPVTQPAPTKPPTTDPAPAEVPVTQPAPAEEPPTNPAPVEEPSTAPPVAEPTTAAAPVASETAAAPAPAQQQVEAQEPTTAEAPATAPTGASLTLVDTSRGSYVTVGDPVTFSTTETAAPDGLVLTRWSLSVDDAPPTQSGRGAPPAHLTHRFTAAGSRTATLAVTDSQGARTTSVVTVTAVAPPTARLTTDPSLASGEVEDGGLLVVFDGSSSTPTTGTLQSWSMDYGDWRLAPAPRYTSGTGTPPRTLQHTYTEPGTYTATLTVVDGSGAAGRTSTTVTAYRAEPTAVLFGGRSQYVDGQYVRFGTVGEHVELETHQSTAGHGNTFASWSVAFDDGSPEVRGTGTPASRLQHTFGTPGDHVITLTVTDSSGRTASTTLTIAVVHAPTATLATSPSPATGPATDGGFAVTFDASGSTPGEGRTLRSWHIDYGDCCVEGQNAYDYGAGAPPASLAHTFTRVGTYDVRLHVTDDTGASSRSDIEVIAYDPRAKAAINGGRYVDVDGRVTGPFGTVGSQVHFWTSGSRPGYGQTLASWSLNAGDGAPAVTGTGTPRNAVQHTYAAAGSYDVALTVTDTGGSTSTAVMILTVTDAPVATMTSDPSPATGSIRNGGLVISFDPRSSAAAAGRTIARWSLDTGDWRSGDGHRHGQGAPTDVLRHTYVESGSYTATLWIEDDLGGTSLSSVAVFAYDPEPTAVLQGGRHVDGVSGSYATTGQSVQFYGQDSRPGYGQDLATWTLSYGDGSPDLTGNGTPPGYYWPGAQHTYTTPDSYTVTLTVTDTGGASSTATVTLTVLDAPTADLSARAVSTAPDGTTYVASFDGSGSTAPAGHRITGWSLDYGDGWVDRGTGAPGADMRHTYAVRSEAYTARLLVQDSAGSSASTTVTVPAAP